MPDYSKGKVYTLRSYQTDEIYIGSSINTLPKRLGEHKKKYNMWNNGTYPYVTSFEILKYDDYYIELLEDYPCNSKAELEKREGELIRSMNCVNKLIIGRTQKEYREDNKDIIREQRKEYRENNKEKLKEVDKQKYIKNKEKILEKNKEKITCECGCIITKVYLPTHIKSKKHQEYLSKE
jgi:hypothetical protein